MKAVQINVYGGPEILEVNSSAEKPKVKDNQVLVEIHAASINPVDWKIRAGFLKDMMPLQFPATLGGDFAGIITEVGTAISDFKIGDQLYGTAIALGGGSGSFAEFAAANSANIARKPKNINFMEAAALPLVGTSAIQALEEHIELQKSPTSAKASAGKQKILIHGGAGGIGHVAIQLAKALGAYVATTVSTDDKEFVKNLGADEVIDYKSQKFEEILKDFDAVFDTVGGETMNKSFEVVKKNGIIVSMLGQPDQELAKKYGVTAIGQGTKNSASDLNRLAELVDAGKIKVHIAKVFPLDQVKEAFTYQEQTHPRGKVVIKIR